MKRIGIVFCCFVLFAFSNAFAKESCKVNGVVKTCIETTQDRYIENIYTYQDSKQTILKNTLLTTMTKDKKVILIQENTNYTTAGLMINRNYIKNNSKGTLVQNITTTTHSNGKRKQVVRKDYSGSKVVYTLTTKFDTKGLQTYYFSTDVKSNKITVLRKYGTTGKLTSETKKLFNTKNALVRDEVTTYHGNGKKKQFVRRLYNGKKINYNFTQRFNANGQASYYFITDTRKNKKLTERKYNNVGKRTTEIVRDYNASNVLVKKTTTTYYPNIRKKQTTTDNYKNSKLDTRIVDYFRDNAKSNLYQKDINYYNTNGKRHRKITNYYHTTTFQYVGFREYNFNVSNGNILNSTRTQYYQGTKIVYYKSVYKYVSGKNTETVTDYLTKTGVMYQRNIQKFDTSNKKTSDLTTHYSNNKTTLRVGYTYQTSTYRYNRMEFANGIKRMNDVTTYKNNTIEKTNYLREYFNAKGELVNKEDYTYKNGSIQSVVTTDGAKASSAGTIAKSYPVSKGIVTSPAWFYPSSFGGGWHPGIDVATYSVKTYGYAQPIKIFNDATVIVRNNSCATTNSSNCGSGFGNYLVVALQHKGKFYTIMYGHQSKLDAKNKEHKDVLDKDKLGYKKNDVIGFVGSSGHSTGYHIHIQVQEHRYAKSIKDIQDRFKNEKNHLLFNVNYNNLGNNNDIYTVNPDILFNLKYWESW